MESLQSQTTNNEPLLVTQTTLIKRRGRGRLPTKQAHDKAKKQSGTIQFINTIHPDDTTNANSLKLIRSHAAKQSRPCRKPQNECAKSLSMGQLIPYNVEGQHGLIRQPEDDGTDEELNPEMCLANKSGYRKLAPKRQVSFLHVTTAPRQNSRRSSSPVQLIGVARKDAYTGFARPLSDDEQYLFDFYLNYVIQYGYGACYHKESEADFQASMREVWVPNAMSQPCLMAAIFHVACRNYAATTDNTMSTKFSVKKLQYRLECLQMAKDAITSQVVATDTTIALALIMASESFFEGDFGAYCSHGSGIIKMVTARGGLQMLGMSGFLTKTVGWSIYSTQNPLVSGPDELEQEY
ncbi:hypothetical protein FSARC_4282 [Fusarium sarcochroum]|uniref:Transcription factor domain-containing protein n=1 Tax=Fusarium sarcochroum TaxID=1208366 RepID=A0A8H4U212_9HYPO|nr:hypothetical protein FSARC_4282 [Fusarium sarcochroum]